MNDMQTMIAGGLSGVGNGTEGQGQDGGIGVPSITANPGVGGETSFTGMAGLAADSTNVTGTDGAMGAGGGGSLPYVIDTDAGKYSGDGGDGYVRISIVNEDPSKLACNLKITTL